MALSKPKLIQSNLPLFSLIALLSLVLANKVQSQDSTNFIFFSFTGTEANLTYQGDASVPPRPSTSIILTRADGGSPSRNSVGRVLYSRPVLLWDRAGPRQATFQSEVVFVIRRYSAFHPGEGMAFFIAPLNARIPTGSTGGNLGIFGSSGTSPSALFAVEFDVHVNPQWDPSFPHIGINVNSRNSINVTRFDYPLQLERPVEARITYDSRFKLVIVDVTVSGQIYRLTHGIDLKTILPQRVQVGLSASTGSSAASVHQIRRWTFTSFMRFD